MNLQVSGIKFTNKGNVTVEITWDCGTTLPSQPAIQSSSFRVWIPADQVPSDLESLKRMALKIASETTFTTP